MVNRVWESGLTRLVLVVGLTLCIAMLIATDAPLDQPRATLLAGLVAGFGTSIVGGLAVWGSWQNTKATLRQQSLLAREQFVRQKEDSVHHKIAEWLSENYLLGTGDDARMRNPFERHTAAPSVSLIMEARLAAADAVPSLLERLQTLAYYENQGADAMSVAQRTREIWDAGDTKTKQEGRKPLGNSWGDDWGNNLADTGASVFGWEPKADALRELTQVRKEWQAERVMLERELRRAARGEA